jgi:hypothetical protein
MPLWERLLIALVVLAFAIVGLGFGVFGILEGAVNFPSRQASGVIVQAESPVMFWASVGVWLVVGLGLFSVAVAILLDAARRLFR